MPEKDDGSASAHVVPVSAPGVRLRRFAPDSPLEGGGFEPSVPEKLEGWIEKLLVNTTGQAVRRGEALLPVESGLDLEKLMAQLTPKARQAIQFVKLEGLSVGEAAARSGMSASAIKVSVHRGLKALSLLATQRSRS